MGIFGLNKKEKIIDLSKGYRPVRKIKPTSEELDLTKQVPAQKESAPVFPFFNSNQQETYSSSNEEDFSNPEEKRKKLAKRLVDMTNRIEELDNKIYHLQQRLEVLEKKEGLSGFESNSNNFNGNGLAF